MVIDNFLDNAAALRDVALGFDYPHLDQATNFPGRNSQQRLNLPDIDQTVASLARTRLTPMPGSAHGKTRLTLANDRGVGDVHLDMSHWSGILYLSRPEDCSGGTDFFRHKATGLESTLLTKQDMAAQGWEDDAAANAGITDILKNDGTDRSKWELTTRIPMRFNRLILLRPWLWHAPADGFGSSLEDGRLVLLLFYNISA